MTAAPYDREARSGKRAVEFDSLLPEGVRRCETRGEAFVFARLQQDDFDLRVERLAERRQDGDLAEARRMRGRQPRQGQRGRKDCDGDRSTHDSPALVSS